jgi:hypothetical protein
MVGYCDWLLDSFGILQLPITFRSTTKLCLPPLSGPILPPPPFHIHTYPYTAVIINTYLNIFSALAVQMDDQRYV